MSNAVALAGVSHPASSAGQSSASASRRKTIGVTLIALALALFIGIGLCFTPLLGLQTDEVMFAKAWWNPRGTIAWFSVFHHRAPSMLMSYLGALKSWLYAPLLSFFPMSEWLIRVPVILAAAASIGLAARFVFRAIGDRNGKATAWFGAVAVAWLLALDDTVIVTSVFDWGPVVLQNLLLVIALLLAEKFYRERRALLLFWIGFALGLALWNKALFLWNLSGIAIAALVFAFPLLRRLFTWKRAGIALIGLVLGASPLIRFNLGHRGNTVEDNTRLEDGAKLQFKARQTSRYLNGLSAQDALVDVFHPARDHTPRIFGRVALSLESQTGEHFSSWICWVGSLFLLAGLIVASTAQRRWIAFLLLSAAIGWIEALLTRDAGLSIHHSVLFFFQWYCALGISVAAVCAAGPNWARALALAGLALLCARSFVAATICYADMLAFEPHLPWTNADGPLVADLLHSGVKRAVVIDWGISDVISTRSRNRIDVDMQGFPLAGGLFQTDVFRNCAAPDCVVVDHAPPNAVLPQAERLFYGSLATAGLVTTGEKTFADTHGVAALRYFHLRFAN